VKKIVLASAAMGGAALVAFGASGTFAAFSDQTASDIATAGAGALFLSPDGTVQTTTASSATNLAPGDTTVYRFYVQNDGSLSGKLTNTFKLLTDLENGCTPAEQRGASIDGDCTDAPGSGDLAEVATITASYGPVANRDACTDDAILANQYGPFSPAVLNNQSAPVVELAPGAGYCTVLRLTIPEAPSNNIVQTDSTSFQLAYRLDQV